MQSDQDNLFGIETAHIIKLISYSHAFSQDTVFVNCKIFISLPYTYTVHHYLFYNDSISVILGTACVLVATSIIAYDSANQ